MSNSFLMAAEEQVTYFWRWDDLHFPRPVTPLYGSMMTVYGGSAGLNHMRELYGLPVNNLNKLYNGYIYGTSLPFPGDVKESVSRWQAHIPNLKADLRRRWDEEQLPEIRRDIDACLAWRGEDDNVASVLAEFDRRVAIMKRHWAIHFEVVVPYGELESEFVKRYRQWLQPTDPDEVFRVIHTQESITFTSNEALWEVVQAARSIPEAAEVLRHAAPAYVLPTWKRNPACRPAAEALERYLVEYGVRASGAGFDWNDRLWIEDPAPVVALLRAHLETDWNPRQERETARAEAQRLVKEALSRLEGETREEFLSLHQMVIRAATLKEDHNYWIDQVSSVGVMRLFFLALGRRLVASGVLENPEDIFYLYESEVREAIAGSADRRALVATRRDEHQRQMEVRPPQTIGPKPEKKFQSDFMGEEREDPGAQAKEFRGYGACKGTVTGTARLVFGQEDFAKVRQGDILVCPTTTPPWTALFRTVAGVVTDAGGILSHAAMVAREYGVPAVVGTKFATRLVRDGERITIDGGAGTVRLEQ